MYEQHVREESGVNEDTEQGNLLKYKSFVS